MNLLTETMEVSSDEEKAGVEEIVAAVEKAGYGASLLSGGAPGKGGSGAESGSRSCSLTGAAGSGSDRGSVQKKAQEEARELLAEGGLDRELHEMAQEQLVTSKENAERFAEELKILLLPRDPNDDKNVIVEIRGGAGGEEAALFAVSDVQYVC